MTNSISSESARIHIHVADKTAPTVVSCLSDQSVTNSGSNDSARIHLHVADKTSPTVVSCPSDQTVTNSSLMVQVEWEEPVFEDNVGIISIQQTHRSGEWPRGTSERGKCLKVLCNTLEVIIIKGRCHL